MSNPLGVTLSATCHVKRVFGVAIYSNGDYLYYWQLKITIIQ